MRQADRRAGGQAGGRVGAALLLTAYPPARLPAQVGHSTDHSPFRDIKRGGTVVVGASYLTGSRGVLGVGPSAGVLGGVRYEVPFASMLAFSLGAAVGQASRYVADPTKNQAQHISGPVNTTIGIFDATARLMLTGGKNWHGFAPYLGAFGGFVFTNNVSSDMSGYEFRTKATYGPDFGLRIFPSRRVAVRIDARLAFWRLTYPLAFKQPSPDGSRVLDVNSADHETTRHPWISAGLGWTF
jgi:hypothetical protein